MKLVTKAPFGNFKPGDEVEVPDGATYDGAYWAEKPAETPAPPQSADKGSDK